MLYKRAKKAICLTNCPAVHTRGNCHKLKNKFKVTRTLVESKDSALKIPAEKRNTGFMWSLPSCISFVIWEVGYRPRTVGELTWYVQRTPEVPIMVTVNTLATMIWNLWFENRKIKEATKPTSVFSLTSWLCGHCFPRKAFPYVSLSFTRVHSSLFSQATKQRWLEKSSVFSSSIWRFSGFQLCCEHSPNVAACLSNRIPWL